MIAYSFEGAVMMFFNLSVPRIISVLKKESIGTVFSHNSLTQFMSLIFLYIPRKTSVDQWFSDVFNGCRPSTGNG